MRQELSPAIDDYGRFRRSQDLAKSTLQVDRQVLGRFLSVNGNVWCHNLKDIHASRHFEEASRTRSASSQDNDHTVLNQFFDWCRQTQRMPMTSNPMYGRRRPKRTRRERNRIPVTRFPRLLDVAGERDPRDRALVGLLLYTLMRDGEISSLRVRDVDLEGGYIRAVIHKTRQEDLMPICSELDSELRVWLTHYTEHVGRLEPHYFLVPPRGVNPVFGEGGKIVRHNSIYKPQKNIRATGTLVKPILDRFGFPVTDENGKSLSEGSHTIRRSGARALFDALIADGVLDALRIVQSTLHHEHQEMTEKYIGITADRLSRDTLLRGKQMYPVSAANVVSIAR